MDKELTDDSFQVVLDQSVDITSVFEVNLGGVRENVCEASEEALPFVVRVRQEMADNTLPAGTPLNEVETGLLNMGNWAAENSQVVRMALSGGRVVAVDATPVITHRRYLTTQIYACAAGVLNAQEPIEVQTKLTKTKVSIPFEGTLKNLFDFIKDADLLSGSQSWPSAYMEYQLFDAALGCDADYVIVDGSLITQNLLTRRQGRDIFRQMLAQKSKKYVGVMKNLSSSSTELRMYGRALKQGEMYIQGSLHDCMGERITAYAGDTATFIKTEGKDILRGVFKPGVKAFGFECRREDLPEIVALLWLDKDGQPGHEIPFLLNQVDAMLRSRYRPGELTALVDSSLPQGVGTEVFFDEVDEREYR